MSARTDLAALIKAGVSAKTTVYDYPAEIIKLPAVVLMPTDPWIMPATKTGFRVNLEAIVQVPRTNPRDHLGKLEVLVDEVLDATRISRFRLVEAGLPEEIKTGDVEAIGSKLLFTSGLEGGLST